MTGPELVREVRTRPHPPEHLVIEAGEAERMALAERFGVVAIKALRAELAFEPDGEAVEARGTLTADLVQLCAVSDEEFPVRIDEPLALRFVREARAVEPDEEVELPGDEPDEIEFAGDSFDVGEAVAQSLGLAIDPYAEGPNADAARREAGIVAEGESEGPLADLLRGLRPN
jgi:uncharacterized metal-binding protein YceD (DUF177 family)